MRGSAINLSQEQYEAANATLGGEYRDTLGQYVDVAGETDDVDTRSGTAFREAGREQRQFVNDLRSYRQTVAAYREARRNGNRTQARRLARRLLRQADRINATGRNLSVSYRTLSNTTRGVTFENATQVIEAIRANVTEQNREIRNASFVSTQLTVAAPQRRVSFADPLSIRVRIETANGSFPANRPVLIRVGDQSIRTRTGPNGSARLQYRPVLASTGQQNLSVAYLPRNSSLYLGAQGQIPVRIEQTPSNLTASLTPSAATFGTEIRARGRLTAADRAVSGVPVRLSLDGTVLATTHTDGNGSYSLNTELPATVEPGSHDLRVTVPLGDRAIAGVNRTRSLVVEPTDTTLSLSATRTAASNEVRFRGRLQTADGRPIASRAIQIQAANGSVLGTVQTNASGEFRTRITVPTEQAITLVAAFDGTGTSLSDARATDSIVARDGASDPRSGVSRFDWWPWLVAVGAVALLGGALYAARVLAGGSAATETVQSADAATSATDAADETSSRESQDSDQVANLRSQAHDRFDAGAYDAAVETAYWAIRRHLVERGRLDGDPGPGATHWTIYRAAVDRLSEPDATTLREVVEAYERAAFAPDDVEADTAEAVLVAVDQLTA